MSRQIQIRRGTSEEHENFTGAIGEITLDTTNNTLRVHDGETAGGTPLAKQSALDAADYVVESQAPTEANNYTWYRKYKSGWVEQGGTATVPTPSVAPGQSAALVTFLIPMLCTEQRSYKAFISRTNDPGYTQEVTARTEEHSSTNMYVTYFTTIMPTGTLSFDWVVFGMAA